MRLAADRVTRRCSMRVLFLLCACLLLGGCRSKKRAAAPPPATVQTAPSSGDAQRPADLGAGDAASAAAGVLSFVPDMAAQGLPAAAASEQDVIVFALNEDSGKRAGQQMSATAIPAVCFSAKKRRLMTGRSCLRLMPPAGATLRLGDSRTVVLGQRHKTTCYDADDDVESSAIAFKVTGPPRAEGPQQSTYASYFDFNPFAIWPETAAARIQLVEGSEEPNPDELRELMSAVRKSRDQKPVPAARSDLSDLLLTRRLEADLDGDGLSEVFYDIYVRSESREYLFVRNGRSPRKLSRVEVVLPGDEYSHDPEPIAVMDLDQDGRPELLLKRYAYSGSDLFFGKLKGTALMLFSATSCKPIWID